MSNTSKQGQPVRLPLATYTRISNYAEETQLPVARIAAVIVTLGLQKLDDEHAGDIFNALRALAEQRTPTEE